eukprot:COSAG04_NODE_8966_length_911_cov_1.213054_1_plen_23_part_10
MEQCGRVFLFVVELSVEFTQHGA